MNNFGVKTGLSKTDRSYLVKKSKKDLINEAILLNIMVDERLTKEQIFNLIKKQKENIKNQSKYFDMGNLFDSLSDIDVSKQLKHNDYSNIRNSDVLYYPGFDSRRLPPGSKVIRKEEGLTKTQKTAVRKEIKNEIDKLSDLLEQFK